MVCLLWDFSLLDSIVLSSIIHHHFIISSFLFQSFPRINIRLSVSPTCMSALGIFWPTYQKVLHRATQNRVVSFCWKRVTARRRWSSPVKSDKCLAENHGRWRCWPWKKHTPLDPPMIGTPPKKGKVLVCYRGESTILEYLEGRGRNKKKLPMNGKPNTDFQWKLGTKFHCMSLLKIKHDWITMW